MKVMVMKDEGNEVISMEFKIVRKKDIN